MKVRYTRRSLLDLSEIYDYIAADNPGAAQEVIEEIRRRVDQLLTNPLMGRIGRVAETRELVITRYPYIVVYRDTPDEVQILSVVHTARAWPASF